MWLYPSSTFGVNAWIFMYTEFEGTSEITRYKIYREVLNIVQFQFIEHLHSSWCVSVLLAFLVRIGKMLRSTAVACLVCLFPRTTFFLRFLNWQFRRCWLDSTIQYCCRFIASSNRTVPLIYTIQCHKWSVYGTELQTSAKQQLLTACIPRNTYVY